MSMNTSQFMDKQITEFSAMQTSNVNGTEDLSDSPNPGDDQNHRNNTDSGGYGTGGGDGPDGDGEIEEEIDPRYDFQPIRTFESQTVPPPTTSPPQPMDSSSTTLESSRVMHGEENGVCDDIMVAIDLAIKRHNDNLLYSLEGINSMLAQLDSRTRLLENSLDDLKMSIGDTVGKSDGKLKQLENILIEVKTGVQVLRDKKEEESRQLSKSASSQVQEPLHQSFQQPNHIYIPPQHPTPPQQSYQQPNQTTVLQQPPIHFTLPVENAAPTLPPQNTFPQQISGSVPQTEIPFVPSVPLQQSFHPPGQPQESTRKQYQVPVHQPAPHQHYQITPQYSQLPQTKPLFPIKSEGRAEYATPVTPQHQTYPPLIRPSMAITSQPPPTVHPQQLYGPNPNTYEPSTRRNGYGPQPLVAGYPEAHNYNGSPSQYSSKTSPFSSSFDGGNNLQRLPTAKLLPQSTPVGSSSNGSTGNRVPIDDVVDKVATMGFSKEQVKETVKKLTENGQSVDLNVVLDKLMNGG